MAASAHAAAPSARPCRTKPPPASWSTSTYAAVRPAPRRIGVAYQLRDLADPGQWIAAPALAGNKGDYYPLLRLSWPISSDGPSRMEIIWCQPWSGSKPRMRVVSNWGPRGGPRRRGG